MRSAMVGRLGLCFWSGIGRFAPIWFLLAGSCQPAIDVNSDDALELEARQRFNDDPFADACRDGLHGAETSSRGRREDSWPFHRMCIDIPTEAWDNMHDHPKEEIESQGTLSLDGVTYRGVRFEIHGDMARRFEKKSYRVVLDDDVVGPDLFRAGDEHHRRFVLQASWVDQTFLRNRLVFDLTREAGGLAPRVTFAVVYANGTKLGLYLVIEKIDKPYLRRQGFDSHGNLYKAESHDANWGVKDEPLLGFEHEEGEDNPTDDLGKLLDVLNTTPLNADDFAQHVEPALSLQDYQVFERVQSFSKNNDGFTKNYFLYHDINAAAETDEARFRIVSWDSDATFGRSWGGRNVSPEGLAKPNEVGAWAGWDAFAPRLFSIPAYRDAYLSDYAKALAGPWTPEVLKARIEADAEAIRAEATRDLARWQPERDFDGEIAYLLECVERRHAYLTDEIESSRALEP